MTTPVSDAHRRISAGEMDAIFAVIEVVDRRGRESDERWGSGRLPTLVPIEWAERFKAQARKFNAAVWSNEVFEVRKHGEAMIRAYDKLEEIAVAAGYAPAPPEQWEIDTPDGLVILVRDRHRMNQVDTGGRRAQIWSLDEVAEVIRKHPVIVAAKAAFPGAEVVSTRPARDVKNELNDSLDGLPF